MTYDPRRHGITSVEDPADPAIAQEWEMARQMNEGEMGPGNEDWMWVPRSSVYVDDAISPRNSAHVDQALVKQYAEILGDLPPLTVQKSTFTLIDGWHRLHASYEPEANTVLVRIRELDVPDSQLLEEAFKANATHGRPLTRDERVAHARYLLKEHPDWPDVKISKLAGIHRRTVANWRKHDQEPDEERTIETSDGRTRKLPKKERTQPPKDDEFWDDVPEKEPLMTLPGREAIEHGALDNPTVKAVGWITASIRALANVGLSPHAFWQAVDEESATEIRKSIEDASIWTQELEEVVK